MRKIREEKMCDAGIFTVSSVFLENSKRDNIVHSVVRFVDTVSVLPVTKDGKIVLEKQYRTPVDTFMIEIPAGKIDAGETPEEAMKREIEEEIGMRVVNWIQPFEAYVSCGYSDEKMYYYIAKVENIPDADRRYFPDDNEIIELIELSLEEIMEMIKKREIVDSKTIMMVYAYAADKEILSERKE